MSSGKRFYIPKEKEVGYLEYLDGKDLMVLPTELNEEFYFLRQKCNFRDRSVGMYAVDFLVSVESVEDSQDERIPPSITTVVYNYADAVTLQIMRRKGISPLLFVEPDGAIVNIEAMLGNPQELFETGYLISRTKNDPRFQQADKP